MGQNLTSSIWLYPNSQGLSSGSRHARASPGGVGVICRMRSRSCCSGPSSRWYRYCCLTRWGQHGSISDRNVTYRLPRSTTREVRCLRHDSYTLSASCRSDFLLIRARHSPNTAPSSREIPALYGSQTGFLWRS
jgi:hypothetical protein